MPLFFLTCSNNLNVDERIMFQQKIDAFGLLSKHHHQLHVMIGEEEGDLKTAFQEFKNALYSHQNCELIPVKNAIIRINDLNTDSENINRLDFLVDYYQSGLSMQVEGILRGYGYLESFSFEDAMNIYDEVISN